MSRRPMSRSVLPDPPNADPRAALRLLSTLAEGAHGTVRSGEDRIAVVRRARGVSLGGGTFAAADADRLVREGLAAWDRTTAPERLVVTEAGHAHLARRAATDDPFRAQHQPLADAPVPGEADRTVRINEAESPLAWLMRRQGNAEGAIGPAAFAAGERLRRDLTMAQTLPRVTANWDPNAACGGNGPRDPASASDQVIAARQRVKTAMHAVGPDFADLLIDICGFLKGLQVVERERRWPMRSGKVVLGLALERLAAHYGFSDEARGPRRGAMRVWIETLEEV